MQPKKRTKYILGMRKRMTELLFLAIGIATIATSCQNDEPSWPNTPDCRMVQIDSLGWYWEEEWPKTIESAALTVQTDKMRLHFVHLLFYVCFQVLRYFPGGIPTNLLKTDWK